MLMRRAGIALAAVVWLTLPAGSQPQIVALEAKQLCVTSGSIKLAAGHRLQVSVPEMRAVVKHSTAPVTEARFTYKGPTRVVHKSGSGKALQEFALKLRAADACNLVYALWRIAPEQEALILVKKNDDKHSSAQCSNQGYKTISSVAVAPFKTGENHTMHAEIKGNMLTLTIDGKTVLEGDVKDADFNGPVGVRSDNGMFTFQLLATAGKNRACPKPGGE